MLFPPQLATWAIFPQPPQMSGNVRRHFETFQLWLLASCNAQDRPTPGIYLAPNVISAKAEKHSPHPPPSAVYRLCLLPGMSCSTRSVKPLRVTSFSDLPSSS